jgi:hypothetical protein
MQPAAMLLRHIRKIALNSAGALEHDSWVGPPSPLTTPTLRRVLVLTEPWQAEGLVQWLTMTRLQPGG